MVTGSAPRSGTTGSLGFTFLCSDLAFAIAISVVIIRLPSSRSSGNTSRYANYIGIEYRAVD